MPGILPMKVIRVGNSAQSRIAQACDRCRSKKIRCDGIRPQCTQCSNVGFECKTSDKLSRRAFPRGYTESLEDRVRALEAEIREFKDLLDEKDEKIDVLSRIHSFSSPSRKCSASLSPSASERIKTDLNSMAEEFIQVETTVPAGPSNPPNSQSCTSALIDAFARKVSESGGSCPEIQSQAFNLQVKSAPLSSTMPKSTSKIPPRLLSDQYINVFFQEWAPLLPILHRPTFLRVYEQYLADPEAGRWHGNKQAVAQLFLIFDIAASSSRSRIRQTTTSYEPQWRKAIHSMSSTVSISALQCHILAQLYYLLKANYSHCARHRAIAVSMCHQMGLHHSQKYYILNCLELETRKKVFWCQYALDKFMSASSGAPTLLRESDISAEYPADVDDENLTEQGFSPALPGELTKISSALALFRISRILSHALDQLLPASASHRFSINNLNSITDELDQWLHSIPTHLRMKFLNEKPSTGVISDRSPLLSLAYFFIRSLIHRPLICHGLGSNASTSLITIADSAKHIVQILELLDERKMNYTFPISKTDLLLSSGFSLLWQCYELSQDSKLAKDNQKSVKALSTLLVEDSPVVAAEFQRIACALVPTGSWPTMPTQPLPQTIPSFVTDPSSMLAPDTKSKSARRQLQAIASRFSSFTKPHQARAEDTPRRATVPAFAPPYLSPNGKTSSQLSLSSTRSLPVFSINSPPTTRTFIDLSAPTVNLDYFPLGEGSLPYTRNVPHKAMMASPDIDWASNIEGMDGSNPSMYDGLYNGVVQDQISQSRLELDVTTLTNPQDWLDREWPASAIDLSTKGLAPQSVLSASGDSITSGGEEFSGCGSNRGSTSSRQIDLSETASETCRGITMPVVNDMRLDLHPPLSRI